VGGPDTPEWALPSDRRRPLPEVISDRISRLIGDGEIALGESLPNEHELARRFGVGRSSIRTALQRLQHLGLVDVTRGRGWYVVAKAQAAGVAQAERPDEDDAFERAQLFEVRIALESTATSLAAIRATDEELQRIVDASNIHRATRASDVDELVRTDELFHGRIVDASHNQLLSTM
jgi:GntR family transcriptional regulator, transcriptional repressor for pyruvate dehydrogenase complex